MKRIVWTEPAKADVRRLDKPTAMRILAALHRFSDCEGDVKTSFPFSSFEGQAAPQNSFVSLWLADSNPIGSTN